MTFITSWIIALISAGGYVGLIGLMAVESACIPLPSEVIMPFAGYLASIGHFNLFAVATAGALGCNLGSAAAYLLGDYGGRKFILHWGRYVLLSPRELERVEWFFARYGRRAALIGRLLPVVRTYISLPAGTARMPFIRFQLYTFLGSWLWCFALAYLGMKLGQEWNKNPTVQALFRRFDVAVIGVLALAFALYAFHRWREMRD